MNIKDVNRVAVCGAGTMGPALAQIFASVGYSVMLYDIDTVALQRSTSIIRANLNTLAEQGLLETDKISLILDKIKTTDSVEEACSDVDLLIECITEKKEIKRVFYKEIDKLCPQGTIIASNTSYLNIFEIVPEIRLPNTIIAHWFAPPHIIPLVEVIRGEKTKKETVDFIVQMLKHVDKVPVVLNKFIPGFCINRIQRIIGREIFYQLDNEIISAEELDLAVKASIIPRAMVLGLVQRYDYTGLDLSANNLANKDYLEPPIDNAPKSLCGKVENGNLGVKTGKGFYDYSDRKLEDVLKERDIELIKVFRDNKHLIDKPI